MLFWLISRAEVATPPALLALPGANRTPFAWKYSVALDGGRHVCALRNSEDAVCNKCLCVVDQQLVLRCARQSDVALDTPNALALVVLRVRTIVLVLGQARTLDFLDLLDCSQVDAFRIIDPAGGIAHGDDLAAQFLCLLTCIDGHVASAGNRDGEPAMLLPFAFSIASVKYSRP